MEAAGRGTRVSVDTMTFDGNQKGDTDARHTAKLRFEKVETEGRLRGIAVRGGAGTRRSSAFTSSVPVRFPPHQCSTARYPEMEVFAI